MGLGSKLARVGVLVITLGVIVGGAAALPWLNSEPTPMPEQPSAYDTDTILPERAPAEGRIQPEDGVGTGIVLIDAAHLNRYEAKEIQPLVRAITEAGYRVRFAETDSGLREQLNRSKALLVIDPAERYDEEDIEAVERFVEDGGHLLMLGEPTRSDIQFSQFGVSLVTLQNRLTPLANAFGISYGEGYLYNMESNDGNFKNVFAAGTDVEVAEGIDRTALYTAAEVSVRNGDPILMASDGTRTARGDRPGEFAVAVRDASGNVIAVGDVTFLKRGNYNVVDNEQFIANLVEFLTSSTREPPEEPS